MHTQPTMTVVTAVALRDQIETCDDPYALTILMAQAHSHGLSSTRVLDWDGQKTVTLGSLLIRRRYVLRGGGAIVGHGADCPLPPRDDPSDREPCPECGQPRNVHDDGECPPSAVPVEGRPMGAIVWAHLGSTKV